MNFTKSVKIMLKPIKTNTAQWCGSRIINYVTSDLQAKNVTIPFCGTLFLSPPYQAEGVFTCEEGFGLENKFCCE